MQIQQIPHIGSSQLPNPGPSSLGSVESPIRQESQDPCSSDLTRLRNCFIFEKSNFVILEMIAKSSRQHQSSLQWCLQALKLLQTRWCSDIRWCRVPCLSNPRLVVFPVRQIRQGTCTWFRKWPNFGDLVMIQKVAFQRPNSFQWCLRTWKLLRMRCVYDHRWYQNIELLLYHLDWIIWINI